jgi:hypothetical protein
VGFMTAFASREADRDRGVGAVPEIPVALRLRFPASRPLGDLALIELVLLCAVSAVTMQADLYAS